MYFIVQYFEYAGECPFIWASGGLRNMRRRASAVLYGRVAESVDALDSKSCSRKGVRVQVPPRPPN